MRHPLVLLTVFCLLALSACTHIKVIAFDKRQNTVTIQGGKWASDGDYQKAADEYCKGPAALLAMDTTMVGSYSTGSASIYGNTASGSAVTMGIRRYNRLFGCNALEPSPAKPSMQPASSR